MTNLCFTAIFLQEKNDVFCDRIRLKLLQVCPLNIDKISNVYCVLKRLGVAVNISGPIQGFYMYFADLNHIIFHDIMWIMVLFVHICST